jgi:hypothetical protein
MKKLQLFALLMLLSTGYIAQAGQQGGGQSQSQGQMGPMSNGQSGPMKGNGQQGQWQNKGKSKGKHGGGMMNPQMQTQVAAAFGGAVTVDSFNAYAQANDISLVSPVTLAQVQAIQKIIMNLQMGLMQLAQAAGVQPAPGSMKNNAQSGEQGKGKGKGKGNHKKAQLPSNGAGSVSHGPMMGGQYQQSGNNVDADDNSVASA